MEREYQVDNPDNPNDPDSVSDFLNEYAREGWRLKEVTDHGFIFERVAE